MQTLIELFLDGNNLQANSFSKKVVFLGHATVELSVHPKLISYYKEYIVNEEQAKSMIQCNVDKMILSVGTNLRL